MRRPILIALLSFGVLAGYGSGVAHVLHHHHACGWHHDDRGDRGQDRDRNADRDSHDCE
jgi:hypothetical protein